MDSFDKRWVIIVIGMIAGASLWYGYPWVTAVCVAAGVAIVYHQEDKDEGPYTGQD